MLSLVCGIFQNICFYLLLLFLFLMKRFKHWTMSCPVLWNWRQSKRRHAYALGWSLKNKSWKCFAPSRLFRYIGWENNTGTILLESDNVYPPPSSTLKFHLLTLWQYNVNLGRADASSHLVHKLWIWLTISAREEAKNVQKYAWLDIFGPFQTEMFKKIHI